MAAAGRLKTEDKFPGWYWGAWRTLALGSTRVERSRRQDAFAAFLTRACKRVEQEENQLQELSLKVLYCFRRDNIVSKEQVIQLSDHGTIIEEALDGHVNDSKARAFVALRGDMEAQEVFEELLRANPANLPPQAGQAGKWEWEKLLTVLHSRGLNEDDAKDRVIAARAAAEAAGNGVVSDEKKKSLARAIRIEAAKPLVRKKDVQVLLRGLTTLITMNVFLASAVFIGLSLTGPDDVNQTLQTGYYNLVSRLDRLEQHLQERSNSGAAVGRQQQQQQQGGSSAAAAPAGPASNTAASVSVPGQPGAAAAAPPMSVEGRRLKAGRLLAQEGGANSSSGGGGSSSSSEGSSGAVATTNMRNKTSSSSSNSSNVTLEAVRSGFFPPGQYGSCSDGDESKRPVLMAQQITAFMLFLGSSGVAFGLLLSVQPEGELDEPRERWGTWGPYVLWCGFCSLTGIFFLLWSLITMAEVQYGDWTQWGQCKLPWLSRPVAGLGQQPVLAQLFIAYEAMALSLGLIVFFHGWTIL